MGASEEAIIVERLVGVRETVAGLEMTAEAAGGVAEEVNAIGVSAERTRRRSFLMNQALFTMRRFLYLTTLAAVALGAASVKWGYDYLSQMQQGQIALGKFMGSNRAAKRELDTLFQFTAYTPFQFKDVVSAASMLMRFNISAGETNRILRNVTDALAGTTKATPGGLNRIATALGHMMSMGHATGQVLLQLARDGIPGVYDAVKKYFGLTDAQMHHIGSLGLPANEVMTAINQYIEHSRLHGLARREALGSLHGLLTTSRDFISRIMGQAMQPGFSKFQGWIVSLNTHLQKAGTAIQNHQPLLPALFGPHPSGFGADVELAISLLKSLWKILVGSIIPAFRTWLQIFQPLKLLLLLLTFAVGQLAAHTTLLKYAMILLFFAMTPKWAIDFWGSLVARVVIAKDAMLLYRDALVMTWLRAQMLGRALYKIPFLLYEGWVLRAEYASMILAKATALLTGVMTTLYLRFLYGVDAVKALVFWIQFRYLMALEALDGMMETTAIASMYMWDALMGPVGWAIAIITTFGILYWKVKAFHDAVNAVWHFLMAHKMTISFLPVVGQLWQVVRAFQAIYSLLKNLYGIALAIIHPLRTIEGVGTGGGHHKGWLGRAEGVGRDIGRFIGIPGLAGGGTVVGGGWSWVGERGPELAYMPRGSVVTPASIAPNVFPWQGSQFTPNDGKPIQVQLVCDGKVLAQVVAAHKDDVRARL